MSENENESAVEKVESAVSMEFGEKGLELRSFDDFWRFANMVKRSGMVDKSRAVESIMISVQKGAELGISYLDAVHLIPTIKGRPTIEGKGMLALIQAAKVDDGRGPIDCGCEGEGDARVGWCESWRKGWPKARRTEFTWKQAVGAGLTRARGQNNSPSIYMTYGDVMLQWKAVSAHCNKYYGDVLHGLMDTMTAMEVYVDERDITPAAPSEAVAEPAAPDPLVTIDEGDDVSDADIVEPRTEEPAKPPRKKRAAPKRKRAAAKKPKETTEDRAARFEEEAGPDEGDTTPSVCGKGPTGSECMQKPEHEGVCDWQS